ncbi:MAG: DUF935 domain-containing protein [Gammaproteobacteria bacterium]
MATKPQLLGPDGQPIRREVLTEEVAGPTITGVRSVISGYPGDGLNPLRLAHILRDADQGEPLRYFELAEQIEERDLHYAGVLGTRRRSVAQIDITVDAASDAPEHVRHADMVRDWLLRDQLQDEIFDILDAIGKGTSLTEIIWDTSAGQWRPARLEWRDPRWFRFDRHDGTTPLLRTDEGDQPLPAFKFIQAIIRSKSGLPVRSGIARLAAWSWMFKAFTLRDWAIFTQTYGQPIRVGKYGAGATEADKDTLFRAVANIAGDCAAIIPESMLIEFIESKSVGSSMDLYERRADWLDRQVSKAVLGQTATTDAIAGGHAVGQEHRQVQEDIERADAKALAAVLNRDLVRPWIDLEFGPQKVYPRLRIGRPEEEDLKLLAESLAKLVPLGLRVEASVIRDKFGLPDPDPDAEVLEARAAPVAPLPGPAPQEGKQALQAEEVKPPRDGLDGLAAAAEAHAQPAMDEMIDTIRGLIDVAQSLEEVREAILDLGLPSDQLATAMGLAMLFADLAGRDEIASADA